jgi:hypothetical protein
MSDYVILFSTILTPSSRITFFWSMNKIPPEIDIKIGINNVKKDNDKAAALLTPTFANNITYPPSRNPIPFIEGSIERIMAIGTTRNM